MGGTDLLVLAGEAAALLEAHGFVACGRRQDGMTTLDFWGRDGKRFRLKLTDREHSVEALVQVCLDVAGASPRGSETLS
jgi:hypothetical protein